MTKCQFIEVTMPEHTVPVLSSTPADGKAATDPSAGSVHDAESTMIGTQSSGFVEFEFPNRPVPRVSAQGKHSGGGRERERVC